MRLVGWLGCIAAVLLALGGCTTGTISALTGGSVPIGDVDGYVYMPLRATDTDPVGDVVVVITDTQGTVLRTTRTDAQGRFSFADAPDGQMVVRAGDPNDLYAQLQIERGIDDHVDVVLALGPARTDNITGIMLVPAAAAVHVGEEVGLTVYDQSGTQAISALAVNWMIRGKRGGLAAITPDGRFTAYRTGSYTVFAQYWTRGTCLSATSDIVVSRGK